MKYVVYFILIAIAIFFIRKFLSKFKYPKIGAVAVFVGGVKSGKSGVSVGCALSNYRSVRRSWKIKCAFINFINFFRRNKIELPEEPLFYSSIPLRGVSFVPLTRDHLLRKLRFNYKSVVFIDEASLIADSQLIKNVDINTELLLFFKLFGHETHGGKCILNSHCITDLHYALKRTVSQYFYMHHLSPSFIPFVSIAYMREERYSDDGSATNIYDDDLEYSLKRVLMRKSTFKRYDPFCFSKLTDDLPVKNDFSYYGKKDSLKTDTIPSFRPEFYRLNLFRKDDTPNVDKETGEIISKENDNA